MIYRKLLVRVWRDERFRSLSGPAPNAQTVWLYLLLSDAAVIPGLVPIGALGLAERLRWPPEPTQDVLLELEQAGLILTDPKAPLIWIPSALRQEINHPDNPNVAGAWGKALEHVPECPLRTEASEALERLLGDRGEEYLRAWRDGIAKGYGNGPWNGAANRSPTQQATSNKQHTASSKQQ